MGYVIASKKSTLKARYSKPILSLRKYTRKGRLTKYGKELLNKLTGKAAA